MSQSLLDSWLDGIEEHRRRLGQALTIGATAFILDFVPLQWNRLLTSLHESEIRVNVRQISSHAFPNILTDTDIDLALGGIVCEKGKAPALDQAFDFVDIGREGCASHELSC